MSNPPSLKTPSREFVSNLFHGAVALGFGLLTLVSALHVAAGLI